MINFYVKNYIPTSKITTSSENALFPFTNVNDARRTKVYRSTSNADSIIIDLGDRSPVDSFAIADNWVDGFGVTSVTLEGNNVNDFTAPPLSETITLNNTFGVAYKEFTQVEYRFFKISMTSTLGYCELANVFLGAKTAFDAIGPSADWAYSQTDNVTVSANRYNQKFYDDRGTYRNLNSISFEIMDRNDVDVIFEVYDIARTVHPIFVRFDDGTPSVTNNEERFSGFFRMTDSPQVTAIAGGFYNVTMELEEVR